MTEQERREHFAFLNGVAADMKESRKEIIDLLEEIKAEINKALSEETISDNRQQISDVGVGLELALNIIDKHIKEYTA